MSTSNRPGSRPLTLWIPGGTGMLGQAVAAMARSRNYNVMATSSTEVDVTHPTAVDVHIAETKPYAIINCAAHTGVDACETDVDNAMKKNAEAPGYIAKSAKAHGAFAVHVSTDYVFGDVATRTPLREDAATAPHGVYGQSKLLGEQAFLQHGGGAVVRTSWLFGPGGKNFVKTMITLMGTRPELRVVADQEGRPTFTVDLAEFLLDVVNLKARGIFHYANSGAVSWHAFAEGILAAGQARGLPLLCERVLPIATVDYPTPAKRPAYSVMSTDKATALTGKAPPTWQDALSRYLAQTTL